jgi:hypothetical protein
MRYTKFTKEQLFGECTEMTGLAGQLNLVKKLAVTGQKYRSCGKGKAKVVLIYLHLPAKGILLDPGKEQQPFNEGKSGATGP